MIQHSHQMLLWMLTELRITNIIVMELAAIIIAAVAAAASIGSSIWGVRQNDRNFDKQLNYQQSMVERQITENRPQTQMKNLLAAGLTPSAAAQALSPASNSFSVSAPSAPNTDLSGVFSGLSGLQDSFTQASEITKNKVGNQLTVAEIAKAKEAVNNMSADTEMKNITKDILDATKDTQIKLTEESLNKMSEEVKKIQEEVNVLKEQKDLVESDAKIRKIEHDFLDKYGIPIGSDYQQVFARQLLEGRADELIQTFVDSIKSVFNFGKSKLFGEKTFNVN